METNYWEDKSLIFAQGEEKEKHLKYEIWMFRSTCDQHDLIGWGSIPKTPTEQFHRNILVESLAVHTRLLVDFFYNDLFYKFSNKKDRLNINDIIAQDFISGGIIWINERPELTQNLRDAREKANKQLAHLSTWRIKIERDGKKSWDWKGTAEDMEKVIAKFESLK